MIVVFNCPQCRKSLRADDAFAGKKIQCRACKMILFVPGIPPIRQANDSAIEQKYQPPEFSESRQEVPSSESAAEPMPEAAFRPLVQHDHSYGLASLFLATLSFLLFFTPAVLAGMTGVIGASIAFFAGLFTSSGCFLLCWHGYRLARRAEEMPSGHGYAEAGKIVNKFFLKFYALGFVFFLVGGIIAFRYAKNSMDQLQNSLQGLDQLKGLEKVLSP